MIVTFTANPSVDRTVTLDEPLERGAVMRATSVVSYPGGKGVNVARVIAAAGQAVVAVLPGGVDDPVVSALRVGELPLRTVPVPGEPRVNLTIAEADGTTTKINEPGRPLHGRERAELTAVLVELAPDASWVVLSGSLPPGAPPDWYAELVATLSALRGGVAAASGFGATDEGAVAGGFGAADGDPAGGLRLGDELGLSAAAPAASGQTMRGAGVRIAVDTSDVPLLAMAAGPVLPDLVKPNTAELAQLSGLDLADDSDPALVAAAAARLVERGFGAVLATLGAAGAVLVNAEGAWFASAPRIVARSTVGAGDSALAGYLLADVAGASPADRLRAAVAYGSAATALPGTELPGPDQVRLDDVRAVPLGVSPGT
ncbi:1-phosphofructokinase family hexose kinase [Nocardia camponoti]|uniref:1-phosphofructokinase n=1 Tax=Nocardia camponoti TaxID=1616106 RepID=A0A917QDH3_9NOCA|nr:PfkB family carbohydrate kinase [Nocardia camponoti]GGK45172.1 1-phosphofructokinase [Nocardia camponoti]